MPPITATVHFSQVVPGFMAKLLRDFPELEAIDAAAIFGNAGHESVGLTDDQEDKPTVAGSRGGLNWMQWTGPRRRAFEAYCVRAKLDPNSDLAAYKYLYVELKGLEGSEKGAIKAVLMAQGLEAKVKAFEKAYLRAGVKHYDSRLEWANRALKAWEASPKMLQPDPFGEDPKPAMPKPKPSPAQVEADRGNFPILMPIVVVLLVAAVVAWFIFIKR